MSAPIGRLWGRRNDHGAQHGDAPASPVPESEASPSEAGQTEAGDTSTVPALVVQTGADADAPEQPVLLTPVGTPRQVHVGDVLPPARRGWAGGLVRVPTVPKRAILAAGVCAGLVAPTLARHLATRLLIGSGGKSVGGPAGTLEITRIVYHGPATAEVVTSIIKSLTAGRG